VNYDAVGLTSGSPREREEKRRDKEGAFSQEKEKKKSEETTRDSVFRARGSYQGRVEWEGRSGQIGGATTPL